MGTSISTCTSPACLLSWKAAYDPWYIYLISLDLASSKAVPRCSSVTQPVFFCQKHSRLYLLNAGGYTRGRYRALGGKSGSLFSKLC
jgi:hypothetical protein